MLLCTALFSSCVEESMRPEEKNSMVLYFSAAGSDALTMTKAVTVPGIDNYNENKITSVDCFFYPDGGTDSDAVMVVTGRAVEAVGSSTLLYKVTIRYTSAQAMDIFRSETDGTAKVFVIANSSLSYDSGGTSIAELKQKLLERDFSAQMLQGSFVMFSEDDEDTTEGYTITMSSGTVTGHVPMDRVSANSQLFLKIPKWLPGVNAGEIWKPDTANVKVYLANALKRGRVNAPYTPASDGSDYFNFDYRPVYSFYDSSDPDDAVLYNEVKALNDSSWMYRFTSFPFYSYPCSWRDIHDHATQYIVDIPWYIEGSGVEPSSRYYQISANLMASTFERNHYYRTYAEIKTLGGVDESQSVTVPECNYVITPWIKAAADVEGYGFPVVGDFETQSYLVVEPSKVILNNEETAVFDYLSSSALRADSTRVIKVIYYNYKNSTSAIERTESTSPTVSGDSNTNSTAIRVNIDDAGEVRVTHKLYNDDGSQKIFVEYEMVVRIYNNDGLYEDVTIVQRPPLYVLMKDGDNAFVDGYFRHVKKTGGGAPFENAWAHTASQWSGYYRSVSYYLNPSTKTKNNYWYLGTGESTSNTYRAYYGMVNTPYGNMYSTPGNSSLSLYDITGVKLSAFSESYHSYTVNVGTDGSGAVEETFNYRIGDPRVDNDFTGSPKLVDYLTGMGATYTTAYSNVRQYTSSNVYTAPWGSLADKVKMGTKNHDENTLIAPYILISSSYLSQISTYGVTFEEAQKRCATYQEGGYPAGRWRLPTEAEIMFVIERQRDNSINVLFNISTTGGYWAASGYYFETQNLYRNTDNSRTGAARCVYDAWYWGDEPVEAAAYTYTPMP